MDSDTVSDYGAREIPYEKMLIAPFLIPLLLISFAGGQLYRWLLDVFDDAISPNSLLHTFALITLCVWICAFTTMVSFGIFTGVAVSLGSTVNERHKLYASIPIGIAVTLYYRKDMSRSIKEGALSTKLQALHLSLRRINQVLFSRVNKEYFEHLKPDVWFDIVAYISDSNDGVRSYYKEYDWLKCFILPLDKDSSSDMSEDYQGAYAKFELAPAEFIKQIESFSALLLTRDLCKLLLEYLGKSTHEHTDSLLLDFWVRLQAAIHDIMQSARSSSTAITTQASHLESLDQMRRSLQQLRESKPECSYSSTVNQLQECLDRFIEDKELQTTDMIEKSWREEHRRSLQSLFDGIENQYLVRYISGLLNKWSKDPQLLSAEQDKFQSNICVFVAMKTGREGLKYREAIQTLREMSVIKNEQSKVLYEAFEEHRRDIALQQQIITCLAYRFILENLPQKGTEIMRTLHGTNSSTGAWQKMWRLAVEAELDRMIVEYIDPHSPLLNSTAGAVTAPAVGTTQTTAPAAGAATAPVVGATQATVPAAGATQATAPAAGATQATAPAAGATQATAAAVTTLTAGVTVGTALTAGATPTTPLAGSTTGPTTSRTPPSLRKLLEWDFDYWAKKNGQLNNDKANMNVPTAAVAGGAAVAAGVALTAAEVAAAAAAGGGAGAGAGAGAARRRVGPGTTGRYVRVETYSPEYTTWPSYSYGNSLYSELSANIHKYNRSYNIDKTNFTESQRIILQWLSPGADNIDRNNGDVSWGSEWGRRGFPTTI